MKKNNRINLAEYLTDFKVILVGRRNGEKLLERMKTKGLILKELEQEFDIIEIVFPEETKVMNGSFFLGWLETRVQDLGKVKFLHKYKFIGNEIIAEYIEKKYVNDALKVDSLKKILS